MNNKPEPTIPDNNCGEIAAFIVACIIFMVLGAAFALAPLLAMETP